MSGYGCVSSSYYAPDPNLVRQDIQRCQEMDREQDFRDAEKYREIKRLLNSAGFDSVSGLIIAYQNAQKSLEYDMKYIDQLRVEILKLSEQVY